VDELMRGKVVVITGATSGIGRIAAERLAGMGARIVSIARDRARGQAALARLRGAGGGPHSVHYADLSSLGEMKRAAAEVRAAEPRVDVLVNNAGAVFGARGVTADGMERTFALNHVAYFVLTRLLLDSLAAAAPARVVNVASGAHRRGRIDWDDLQFASGYGGLEAYRRSKLCNILFTRELARRLGGTGITANSLHPGFVASRFGDESGGWLAHAIRLAKLLAISPEEGADTLVYLASSPEVADVTGRYFYKRRPVAPSAHAEDDVAARRLWAATAALAGLAD
jgi:NAD(P)-dependent dehydrogenase (short-subunit alcohol dehydrogenase family)